MSANLSFVTTELANVVVSVPVEAGAVTSPTMVMAWSPVFVLERFDPLIVPEATIDVGVMAPRLKAIVPLEVMGPPEELIPLAPDTFMLVTVPAPAMARICATVARLLADVLPSTMTVKSFVLTVVAGVSCEILRSVDITQQ
jgi:hypothetical protein